MDDKELDDFFRDRIGSIEQEEFDAAALDALVPELVALNRRVPWYAAAWAWLWQGGRGFYFLIMAALAYMLWMQQGQLGEMEMRIDQLRVQPDTVWLAHRDTIWREIPAEQIPALAPQIVYRQLPAPTLALRPSANRPFNSNHLEAPQQGFPSSEENRIAETQPVANAEKPLSGASETNSPDSSKGEIVIADRLEVSAPVAAAMPGPDSVLAATGDSASISDFPIPPATTALPKSQKERKPWLPHFQIQTGLYGMGWNGKVDVGKGEGFSAGGVEAVFMLDEHIGIFAAPGIASFRYEIESEAQGTYQLDTYPPLVPGEPLPDLHEVKMNGSALMMPLGLRYMMSPIGLLTPYVNGGLVGRKFISQDFTYEIIENGQELKRSVAGGPDTWKWASLYGSVGAQYRLGNFHPFLSLNYQKDFNGQGVEGRQYQLIGLQGGFLYRIK